MQRDGYFYILYNIPVPNFDCISLLINFNFCGIEIEWLKKTGSVS